MEGVLILAFRLGEDLFPLVRWKIGPVEGGAGYVLAALFGFHSKFYDVTSKPYTEGLSFLLLLGGAILLRKVCLTIHQNSSIGRWAFLGGLFGFWCALLFLARSQFLLVTLGTLIIIPWIVWTREGPGGLSRGVSRGIAFGASFAVIWGVTFFPEWYWLSQYSAEPLHGYLRFDQFQATSILERLRPAHEVSGLSDYILNRLKGVVEALIPGGHHSYSRAFHALGYSPFVAVLFLLNRSFRQNFIKRVLNHWTNKNMANLVPLVLFISGAGGMVYLHHLHLKLWHEWHFAQRQGLILIAVVFSAWVFLTESAGKWGRAVANLMVFFSFLFGMRMLYIHTKSAGRVSEYATRYDPLASWINENLKPHNGALNERVIMAVPADSGKLLAWKTPRVAYQEYQHESGYGPHYKPHFKPKWGVLEKMVNHLGVKWIWFPRKYLRGLGSIPPQYFKKATLRDGLILGVRGGEVEAKNAH